MIKLGMVAQDLHYGPRPQRLSNKNRLFMKLETRMRWRLIAVIAIAIGAAVLIVEFPKLEGPLLKFIEWLRSLGPIGTLLLALVYVPVAVLVLPTWPITWSAGFILGLVPGVIAASLGGTLGAVGAFLSGRFLARQWVERKFAARPLFQALNKAIEANSFKIVALSRLSPVLPYNILNYVFGISRVRLSTFALATWLGMLPVTAMHVYLGTAIKNAADLWRGRVHATPATHATLVVGILATALVTVVLTRAARRALAGQLGSSREQKP